ncbi:hypothetical protein EDD11_001848 [Mortierella claussenii]|nr:hypothetical protein EDD11_001848 [Mortierella claussenii]
MVLTQYAPSAAASVAATKVTAKASSRSLSTTVLAAAATKSTSAAGQEDKTCPTIVARPRLSPLPYIYLRDLPYYRSTDLQQRLVDRQLRLRKEREVQRSKMIQELQELHVVAETAMQETGSHSTGMPVEDGRHDLLLLVEHTPTYTNGRRNRGAQAVGHEEAVRLQSLGATYVESLRGGEITFHGPGQLVVYPILDLKPVQLSVRCFVSYLEKAIIATCAEWGVKAITTENTGVWINDQKKIAAIGVHVQRYITSHGLALNCDTNLNFFKEIVACGLVGKETTSLSQELCDPSISVQRVIPTFLKGFSATFNRAIMPLSEVDPELERMIQEFVETGAVNSVDSHRSDCL